MHTAKIAAGRASTILEFLRGHSPFGLMEEAHLAFLEERVQTRTYASGEAIVAPEQGRVDRLYIVKEGSVMGEHGSIEPDGADAYWIIPPGETFPLAALLARGSAPGAYRALEDTTCIELPAKDFEELRRISPAFEEYCSRRAAGFAEQSKRISQIRQSYSRFEQQPLSSPLSALIRRKPVSCSPDTAIRDALLTMQQQEIGAIIVCEEQVKPVGIFTLHDLLFKVALEQRDLSQPISSVMKTSLIDLPPHAPAYEAALAMARHGIRHILVVENDTLAGIVSERDLFTLQQVSLRLISGAIRNAKTVENLKQCGRDIRQLAQSMVVQGVSAEQLTRFISTLNDMLTQRIIELELAQLPLDGIELCWIALGSEGRVEQTLSTDQDNGIIFQGPEGVAEDRIRDMLLPAAQRINHALADCGFPLCKGGIMASNPKWCLSLGEWRHQFATWIHRADAPTLLNATIFFDFRALYGAAHLASQLREALHGLIRDNRLFLKRMVENALDNHPPLGLIRDFVVSDKDGQPHSLDLKVNGVTPFVDAARIFSLATGGAETNTARRLRAAARKWGLQEAQVEAWIEAFYFIQLLRLRNHHRQLTENKPASNRIDPDELNELDRRFLKESLRQARKIQALMEKYFQF